jgi:hypothetical protein
MSFRFASAVIYVYFAVGWVFTRWVVMGPVVKMVTEQERLEGELRGRHGGVCASSEALAFTEVLRPVDCVGGADPPRARGPTRLGASLDACLSTALANRTRLAYGRFGLGLFSHLYAYAGTALVYAFVALAVSADPAASGETAGDVSAMVSRSVSFCISLMAGFTAFIDASTVLSDWTGYALRVSGIKWALEAGMVRVEYFWEYFFFFFFFFFFLFFFLFPRDT